MSDIEETVLPPPIQPPPGTSELTQIEEVLDRFTWDTGRPVVNGILTGGYFNRSYSINAGADEFVLRRYDLNTEDASIDYEHAAILSLPDRLDEVQVAKPEATVDGATRVWDGNKHYALFRYIDGAPIDDRGDHLIAAAGRLLAAYHNAMATYRPDPPQRPGFGSVESPQWFARNARSLPALWTRTAALPAGSEREAAVSASVDFLAAQNVELEEHLRARRTQFPELVVHNDFSPQNILARAGQVVGVIDFDLAAWDARCCDVASGMMWFAEDEGLTPPYATRPDDRDWSLNPDRAARFLRSYSARLDTPLSAAEIAAIPWFLRAYQLSMVVLYLDLRLAGADWFPEEVTGLIASLRWMASEAEEFCAGIVRTAGLTAGA